MLLADQLDAKTGVSLKAHRIRRNLSLEKVAKLLGLTRTVYMRHEQSVSRLTVNRLVHTCEVLDAHPEDMLGHALPHLFGENEEHSEQFRLTINELRKLAAASLAAVRSVVRDIQRR